MLTSTETDKVWQEMYAAEVCAMYFGDLTVTYSKRKQFLTGVSFFLSSGAAASVIGKAPAWVPVVTASISALATAYSIAVGLDRKATTMAKLQIQWSQIASDLERLWNHWYDDDAEATLLEIQRRMREASQLGSMEAPNDEKRMDKWAIRNAKLHRMEIPA